MNATHATNFNSGIYGTLFEKKHSDAMGEAVFLFGWLVTRQTKPNGLVFGGHDFSYGEISKESGWPERTLQRWAARLARAGYIEIRYTTFKRMIFWIRNPKKQFRVKQLEISYPPEVADMKRAAHARSGGFVPPEVAGSTIESQLEYKTAD